jgi:hypothetical protein
MTNIDPQNESHEPAKIDEIYRDGSTAAELKKSFAKFADAEGLTVPAHWPSEDRVMFQTLDHNTKQWLLQRHKAMESDYTKKTMDVAKERKKYTDLDKIFDQYKQDLIESGVDEARAVERLFSSYKDFKSNPHAALTKIAAQYGAELRLNDAAKDGDSRNIKQEIEQLKNAILQEKQNTAHLSLKMGRNKIDGFTAMTDVAGKKLYPHFDQLLPQIVMLAHADILEGKQPDIKDLYDRAAWAHPDVRGELLSAQLSAAEKKKMENQRLKIESAKKAGASVYGTPSANAMTARPAKSLREELEAAFRNSLGG